MLMMDSEPRKIDVVISDLNCVLSGPNNQKFLPCMVT